MLSLAASVGFGGGVGCQRARRRACVEGVGCARRAGFRAIFRPQRTVDEALGGFREPPGTRFGGGTRGRHPSPGANASPCSWWSLSSSNKVPDYRLPFAKFLRSLRLPIPTFWAADAVSVPAESPAAGPFSTETMLLEGDGSGEEFGIDVGKCVGHGFVHAHGRTLSPKLASAIIADRRCDDVTGLA